MKNISLIVGMTKQRVIGKNNSLPWHIPEDLKNFKRLTEGNVVIMGRRTYESLPPKFKPLPNRHNIVVSTTLLNLPDIDVCPSLSQAIDKAETYHKKIFIIGGAALFKEALPLATNMYISLIKEPYDGDVYFPHFNEDDWEVTEEKEFPDFTFTIMNRKTKGG